MSALIWSPEAPANDGIDGFDAASAWSLRYGTAWDVTSTFRKEDPSDYQWQAVLETRASASGEVSLPAAPPEEALPVFDLRNGKIGSGPARSAALYLAPLPTISPPGAAPTPTSTDGEDDTAEAGADTAEADLVQRARFRAPLRAASLASGPLAQASYAAQNLAENRAVIVGVIDDAINPLHHRFQLPGGRTRVDYAWAQDATARASGTVPFGRAYDRAELETALSTGPAKEEDKLRALGLIDMARPGPHPLARGYSHGTHVADLAAGFPADEAPTDIRLVTVALPARVTLETSGGLLAPFAIAALDYILDRAFAMSKAEGFPIPVVVNFSYAFTGGPHNGLHILETAIDALVAAHLDRLQREFRTRPARRDVRVVLPAGNGFLSRRHAMVKATSDGPITLAADWHVQPSDLSDNVLEIWLPRGATGLQVSVTPPGGTSTRLSGLNSSTPLVLHRDGAPDQVIGRAALTRQRGSDADGTPRLKRVLLALAPTDRATGAIHPVAPAGRWRVEVTASIKTDERIRAWVQRDEPPVGYTRPGRGSWLMDTAYRVYNDRGTLAEEDDPASVVRRHGTLSGIATGQSTTVVGGWMGEAPASPAEATRPARYASASDLEHDGSMRIADLSAQTDTSFLRPGVAGAGTLSGSVARAPGTSVAAPQETRRRALDWAGLPSVTVHPLKTPKPDARLGSAVLDPPAR